jgi:hypothetical protein
MYRIYFIEMNNYFTRMVKNMHFITQIQIIETGSGVGRDSAEAESRISNIWLTGCFYIF